MEAQQAPPKREWPKWLWGPDGQRARFDSPADIPRDYFPTVEEALAHAAEANKPKAVVAAAPTENDEMAQFRAWKAAKATKAANLAKARAAKAAKAE